jgi:cytoskeletal protein CcmA (bactofilin family)
LARNRRIELSTIIGEDSEFIGDLKAIGGLRIDGKIEGNVESDGFITVSEFGSVKGSIVASECLIAGNVSGNVTVESGLELNSSANLQGDVVAKIVKIHSGAIFNGASKMKNEEKIESK